MFKYGFPRDIKAMQPSFLVSRGHHYLGPDVVNEQGGQRSTTRPGAGGTPSRDKYTLPLYPRSRQCCKFCSLHREIQNYCKVVQCCGWKWAGLMRVWVSAAYWDKWYTGASVQMVVSRTDINLILNRLHTCSLIVRYKWPVRKKHPSLNFIQCICRTTIKADKHDQSRYQGAFAH